MEKVKEILRLHESGYSNAEISRSCQVSLPTIRDYTRKAAAAGVDYKRVGTIAESELRALFGKRTPGRRVKDGELDFERMRFELSRKGVTRQLLWEEYLRERPQGYSYAQFCQKYNDWLQVSEPRLRQDHKAGEKLFVDYAGLTIPIVDQNTGEIAAAQIFVAALGASNYTFAEAVESQELAHWLGSHVRAFEFFGGVTEIVVPDNLKSGVNSPCRYEPVINRAYQELAEHYGIAVIPARSKKPRDKAKVEEAVQNVERRILAKLRDRSFFSVAELNEAIKPLLSELNLRQQQDYGVSRAKLFEDLDKPALRPLPKDKFHFAAWKQVRVNIDYHVEFKRHYYSVPYELVHQELWLRVTERVVEVFRDGVRLVSHLRDDTPGRHTTLKEHMPAEHRYMQEWTPTRLLDWGAKIGPETKNQLDAILRSRVHPEQAYRSCLGLLSLAKRFSASRLEAACGKLNAMGVASMRSVKSMLQTNNDQVKQEHKPGTSSWLVKHSNIRGQFH